MASFKFISDDGKTFEIKGPEGLTFEQAKEVFDKQYNTGSLVGLKPGDVLSAASQAAKGLTAAQAQVGQALSGITGALGGGIASSAGAIGKAASGALASASSVASTAISTVKKAISGPPTEGINLADYAKQSTALAPLGDISLPSMTAVLAQGKKLVGQAADKLTNNKGVGSFGFDIKQLETAGYVKPGTSALVASGTNLASSVLKSASVFTGKDGVKGIDGVLSNPGLQSNIQQDLMTKGVAGLKAVGIPTDALGASGLAGMALNAAKSLQNTELYAKGAALASDVKASFDKNMSNGAFAVNLSETKIPEPFKETEVPVVATDTTNRETLNAASQRVLGNPKIPVPNYGPPDINGFA